MLDRNYANEHATKLHHLKTTWTILQSAYSRFCEEHGQTHQMKTHRHTDKHRHAENETPTNLSYTHTGTYCNMHAQTMKQMNVPLLTIVLVHGLQMFAVGRCLRKHVDKASQHSSSRCSFSLQHLTNKDHSRIVNWSSQLSFWLFNINLRILCSRWRQPIDRMKDVRFSDIGSMLETELTHI